MSSAYKSGNSGVLDLLFSATTFDELTSNIYYLDKISESDRQMVQTIKDTKAALEDDKRRLEEQHKQLEELKQQEEEELKRIQEKAGKDVGAISEASSSDASGAIDFTITF